MSGKRRQKGEGSIYRRASDGRWVGVLELPSGGRRRRKPVYGKTKQQVARKLLALRTRLEAGQNVTNDQITVGRWLDRWSGPEDAPGTGLIRDLAPNTVTSYTQVVRDYIRPELGRVRLAELTPAHVEQMLAALAARRPPAPTPSIGYALRVLRIALSAAQKQDLIQRRNPATLVEAPKYQKRKAVPLGKKEAIGFVAAVQTNRLHALIVLMVTTALRRGELLGLPWRNLHLDERCLLVGQQLQRRKGGGLLIRPVVKTERSEAPVALTALAVRALQAHRARLIEERLAMGDAWRGSDDPVAPDALVFTSEMGTPIDPDNLRRRLHGLLAEAGLDARGPHAVGRHTTATLLGALGVAPAVAAQVLRHSRVTTTLNVYTHVLTEDQRIAADKLDELLGSGAWPVVASDGWQGVEKPGPEAPPHRSSEPGTISLVRADARDPGRIDLVMQLMRLSAPADVADTLNWLEEAGWRARGAWGGPPDWPGNASLAVEFAKEGDRVSIAQDRGQWMLDMYPNGWRQSVDLEIVHAAITGRSDWSGPRVEVQSVQLPSGVSWREWVPRALTWLSEAPDREQMLRARELQRSRDLFPVTRSRRKERSRTRPQRGVESPGPGPGR